MGGLVESVTRRRFVWLAALGAGTVALGGCESGPRGQAPSATAFDTPAEGAGASDDNGGDSAAAEAEAALMARVEAMTLEQKVAQLFVVAPEALVEGVSQVTQAGDATHEGVRTWPVGGIVYFAANLVDPDQVTAMLANVRQFYADDGNVAPFLAVDEEGGTVVRVADNEAFGVQDVGDASALGAAGDEAAAKSAAEQIAAYLKPLGFNLDFAPVCDVVDPLRSDTMGLRSFSSDANVCAATVKAEVQGFLGAGMLCCAKHFPGIGSAPGDSHTGAITVEKTAEELAAVDFVPFKAAIEAGVPMIMVGHVDLPNIVEGAVPASLSSAVAQGMLRDTLGFTGIIVTDSLAMGAITDRYSAAEAAVAALAAGCDVPLMPENFREAYQGVLDAVAAGELTEERIDESVTRILKVKQRYIGL
ncbi:glycoside hydrolase family 3 protein [Adlercreutzia mucosicola]|uniref:glycoside hydrolase family 3 protein n=1 Tax=Adlercreutzia mucosicola TaxID=580026 RepID=UPI0004131799|nr:glycoside hydrolase family 3 N-terminal domain-containing protein [Adlercreutzia mucosicola]MCR2036010.1 glycoside hydrolase family 3 protein [Adlercreutzia mucosicola]